MGDCSQIHLLLPFLRRNLSHNLRIHGRRALFLFRPLDAMFFVADVSDNPGCSLTMPGSGSSSRAAESCSSRAAESYSSRAAESCSTNSNTNKFISGKIRARIHHLLLNLRSPRDCGSCRGAVRACGTSLVRWMALQCAKRTARRLVM